MTAKVNPSHKHKKALLIGGGAPNSSLMAGALVAFLEKGVEFDVISASGAGALMGLLYTAPKEGNPRQALEDWAKVGVSDAIYNRFPVNYKVFMKPGDQAATYRDWIMNRNPFTKPLYDPSSPVGHGFFSDLAKFFLAAMSPSDLSGKSLGMCAHLPFAEQVINFDAIPKIKPEFYINAYNMNRSKMTIWNKSEITPEHLRAAFSFPLIYPPYTLNGEDYIEGAAIDTLNFKALVNDDDKGGTCELGKHCDLDTLVIFDILGADQLIRKPRDLYDAWVGSIITPLVEIAKDDIRLFQYQHNIDPKTGKEKRKLLKVDLMGGIPKDHWPQVMDWSATNLQLLYKVGYEAGLKFCEEHAELLDLPASKPAVKAEAAATA
ncbi:alpha/beta hydrolase [Aquaspirillum sp. LM1]|uniref:patatin-like phospholipase family protein n=1 Tax=Aquaspirillum sp. LM1 TaxID=1938604 RepID=UPI000983EB34|nr:patatin-like phospholipase family protein [Aquaspirillum sp. LM1]AQR64560.1 alpha/beta hydrolase [Aquaspirillum sp. LM1]